jgi:hypothetical protein
MSSMANVLSTAKRVQIVSALVEGCGIRATARMANVSKDTVMKLWRKIGEACIRYQDVTFRNLTCKRLQVDEIWSFVYAKAKNVPAEKAGQFGVGDVWTFTAIDADTKLMPSWMVGSRDADAARYFIGDLAARLANRVQLTSDGNAPYLQAVEESLGADIDYAMLIKHYGQPVGALGRYSPGECIGTEQRRGFRRAIGDPCPDGVAHAFMRSAILAVNDQSHAARA